MMDFSDRAGATRRTRGGHSTQTKNRNPAYQVPESHEQRGRLAFIRDLVLASQSRDVCRADETYLVRAQLGKQKMIYLDRARAINALHAVFSEHVNLVTGQIQISLRNASDAAGLSTISDAERGRAEKEPDYTAKVCISRASRAFADMVELGWLRADPEWQVWDGEAGTWIDKYFEATDLFFEVAGVTADRVERQRASRLGFIKNRAIADGLTPQQVGNMSITQLKAEGRRAWRARAFERRASDQARKKLTRALRDKQGTEQRQIATRRVLAALGDQLHQVSKAQFKDLVNREIASLRKFTGLTQTEPDPPSH